MADELTAEEQQAEAARVAAEAKAAEAEKSDDKVAYATYDKAMATAAKRKAENEALKAQIAELEKSKLEKDKHIDPSKYQEVLETQLGDANQKIADMQAKFEQEIEARDKKDLDLKKLSAVWDIGRKQGMVDDRELLNFVDKELVQIDENGVVNVKSAETVINKLKAAKPYFFQEPKPEKINDKAPDGSSDDTDISTLSFSQQLALKQKQS